MEGSPCDSQAGGVAFDAAGPPWLAAYTRPRHEHKVKQYCEARGIETFLPCYDTWRDWSDRKKTFCVPLFPSYLFVRPLKDQRSLAMRAPGFLHFVRTRREPVPVAAREIESVRRVLSSGWAFEPHTTFQLGDEVEVTHGPLSGCCGRLLRKDQRILVLQVSAISGAIRVLVPKSCWVQLRVPRRRSNPTSQSIQMLVCTQPVPAQS